MDSEAQKRDNENQIYLQKNVNDIIEPLMVELVKKKPDE